ncbi:MAG: enoyl-CoA hydratase/isomerase family protein [Pseudonocardiaceae bacterium]|nr:enoyl-CoA hydratase/isomerase family protein [Pseudonocardiaceae bacterium]
MTENNTIRWDQDADGIVVLTMDDPNQSANTMNRDYAASMAATVDRLEAEKDNITGVVITSAKKTFFAGGDLKDMIEAKPEDAKEGFDFITGIKAQLRRLETLGKPVVAAINGAALGGGLEIALACHHRIAADVKGSQIGLPEVTLGLLPGGGGVTRTVRLMGIQSALLNVLLQGQRHKPAKALELGLVHELVPEVDDLLPKAKEWIKVNPEAAQPWDVKGFKIPGGSPSHPAFAANLPAFPANLRKQLKGANMPAPRAILAAAIEGAQVDIDTALVIESRYLIELLSGQVAKNMIKAFFFDLQHINSGGSRPDGYEKFTARKVGVLGAGMMGAGIAYVCARGGMDVVLKDVSKEAAARGKDYSVKLFEKAVSRGKVTQEKGQEDFIGLHFFSPVDKMPLLEIVVGEKTSDATLAKAFDVAQQIKKTPIVVNDSRGFFTSRVIGTFLNEAVAMVSEGVNPQSVEQAGAQAGYPAPPLQLLDELTLTLTQKIRREAKAAIVADGGTWVEHPSEPLVDRMVDEFDRKGKAAGAGFYSYADGKRAGLWKGLYEHFGRRPTDGHSAKDGHSIPFEDMQERMLFAEALETVKCFDEGVLRSVPDANIGSIMGIGFPPWTGGVIQYINGYPGGVAGFVARSRELASRYGDRFLPPASLVEKAEKGESFS